MESNIATKPYDRQFKLDYGLELYQKMIQNYNSYNLDFIHKKDLKGKVKLEHSSVEDTFILSREDHILLTTGRRVDNADE